jgi:hypothetical protein
MMTKIKDVLMLFTEDLCGGETPLSVVTPAVDLKALHENVL